MEPGPSHAFLVPVGMARQSAMLDADLKFTVQQFSAHFIEFVLWSVESEENSKTF